MENSLSLSCGRRGWGSAQQCIRLHVPTRSKHSGTMQSVHGCARAQRAAEHCSLCAQKTVSTARRHYCCIIISCKLH